MARTIKDIFCRYKTQKGFRVERKAGWDTHGLPVELGVEKELDITKEDIGKKISIKKYNNACKEAVMRYTDVWNELTKKIGFWVDMDKNARLIKNFFKNFTDHKINLVQTMFRVLVGEIFFCDG